MSNFARPFELAQLVRWPPGTKTIRSADPIAFSEFRRRTGLRLPTELSEWLQQFNGARIGPGGILGIRPDDSYCDIEAVLLSYPEWIASRWIPVAGDGCGNFYVLVEENETNSVCFIDTASDYRSLAYVVASNLERFLVFLLESDLGQSGWPFERSFVIDFDPKIESVQAAPMPWEA